MRRRRAERADQYDSRLYRGLTGSLAANVRAMRLLRGWTQEEAAENCEMATPLLQRIEAGSSNITMTTLARLCAGFAAEPEAFFDAGTPAAKRGKGRPPKATTKKK